VGVQAVCAVRRDMGFRCGLWWRTSIRFKTITITFGHHAGDIVIKTFADHLKRCTRFVRHLREAGR